MDVTIVIDTFIGGEVGATTCANIQCSYHALYRKQQCAQISLLMHFLKSTIITTKNEFLAKTQNSIQCEKQSIRQHYDGIKKLILERV